VVGANPVKQNGRRITLSNRTHDQYQVDIPGVSLVLNKASIHEAVLCRIQEWNRLQGHPEAGEDRRSCFREPEGSLYVLERTLVLPDRKHPVGREWRNHSMYYEPGEIMTPP